MATLWERAAHSVYHMLSLYFVFCIFIINIVISRIGFEGGTLVLISSVLGHCLSFTCFILSFDLLYNLSISSFMSFSISFHPLIMRAKQTRFFT